MTQAGIQPASKKSELSPAQQSTTPMVIVDGSSYLFRAFHALPPLTNSRGEPTGAIKGVMSMLQKLIAQYSPTHICVVFDTKGPNHRHEIYPDYKANRGAPPEDLVAQIEPLHRLVRALGLPLLAIPGIEADDVIATLAEQAANEGHKVIISSGDKDLAQLVKHNIHLVNTMKQDFWDEAGVLDKFGVRPDQIIDYLSLIGDKVDNIPGIDKVGPKTAVKWLTEYENLTNLLANKDAIKGKVGENLRAQQEQLALAVQLVTLKTDIDLPVAIQELALQSADTNTLKKLLEAFEFKNDLKKLLDQQPSSNEVIPALAAESAPPSKALYRTLTTIEDCETYFEKVRNSDWVAFDTETNSLSVHSADLIGVSLAMSNDEAVYIPCAHIGLDGTSPEQISTAALVALLKPILESDKPLKIGQNLKYDINVLKKYDIFMQGIGADTMLESYALNPTSGRHDMDSLAQRFLGRSTTSFTDIAGKGAKQKTFDQIELDIAADYASEDAEITWLLQLELQNQLTQHPEQDALYRDFDLPLVEILADMEYHGTLVDAQELGSQSQHLNDKIVQLEKHAFDLVGEPFNLASPKQIGAILYEKMKIPVIKKTPKGAPSTAEGVLQELAKDHELPRLLLEHRSFAKLKSTYTDKLPELIHPKTGRIHTSYHQAVTSTGRLSSSDPNLQNIPIKTEEGRLIRKAFIAPQDYVLVAADYSQIELRLMAHFSKDQRLCQAFANDEDVHAATASEVFGVALDAVTDEHRRAAKAINFGLIYGMSAFGLSNQLDIARAQAQEYIDQYFNRYPGVLEYMDRTRDQAHSDGYVQTLFGRRLYLPDINSKNHGIRQGAERLAINAPLQGTAADIMKLAMIKLYDWIQSEYQGEVQMIMQVHDEVVFEVPKNALQPVQAHIVEIMQNATKLDVPLSVSAGSGSNWLEAH